MTSRCFFPGCSVSSTVHRVPYSQKKAVAQKLNIPNVQLPFIDLCGKHLPASAFHVTQGQKRLRRDLDLAELLQAPFASCEAGQSRKRRLSNKENGECLTLNLLAAEARAISSHLFHLEPVVSQGVVTRASAKRSKLATSSGQFWPLWSSVDRQHWHLTRSMFSVSATTPQQLEIEREVDTVNRAIQVVIEQMSELKIGLRASAPAPYSHLSGQFFAHVSRFRELEQQLVALYGRDEEASKHGIPCYLEALASACNQYIVASFAPPFQTPDTSMDSHSDAQHDSHKVEEIKRWLKTVAYSTVDSM